MFQGSTKLIAFFIFSVATIFCHADVVITYDLDSIGTTYDNNIITSFNDLNGQPLDGATVSFDIDMPSDKAVQLSSLGENEDVLVSLFVRLGLGGIYGDTLGSSFNGDIGTVVSSGSYSTDYPGVGVFSGGAQPEVSSFWTGIRFNFIADKNLIITGGQLSFDLPVIEGATISSGSTNLFFDSAEQFDWVVVPEPTACTTFIAAFLFVFTRRRKCVI